jgi:hypothetical protein
VSVTTLLNSIKQRWDATGELAPVTLFLCQMPETLGSTRIDLPYCIVDTGKTRYLWTFSETCYEVTDVQFTLYVAGSGETLEQRTQDVRNAFDWCQSLTFDDSTVSTYFQPIDGDYSCEPTKYRDGSLIYRSTLRYESFLSKVFPRYP